MSPGRIVPFAGLVVAALAVALVAPAAAAGSDRALARSGLLRSADVGPTWVAHETTPGSGFGPQRLTDCRTVTRQTHRRRTQASVSDVFALGDANVSSSMSVYRSVAAADKAFVALGSAAAQSCLQRVLIDQLSKETPGDGAARAVSIATTAPPRVGDARLAYAVNAQGAGSGSTRAEVAAVLVVTRIGRAILGATFSGPTAPPTDTVERVLVSPARRVAKLQTVRKGR